MTRTMLDRQTINDPSKMGTILSVWVDLVMVLSMAISL